MHCNIKGLFDYLVGLRQQVRRHGETERLRGLEVDHQHDPRWLFDRQIGGACAAENPLHLVGRSPMKPTHGRAIPQERALIDKIGGRRKTRHSLRERERGNAVGLIPNETVSNDL